MFISAWCSLPKRKREQKGRFVWTRAKPVICHDEPTRCCPRLWIGNFALFGGWLDPFIKIIVSTQSGTVGRLLWWLFLRSRWWLFNNFLCLRLYDIYDCFQTSTRRPLERFPPARATTTSLAMASETLGLVLGTWTVQPVHQGTSHLHKCTTWFCRFGSWVQMFGTFLLVCNGFGLLLLLRRCQCKSNYKSIKVESFIKTRFG